MCLMLTTMLCKNPVAAVSTTVLVLQVPPWVPQGLHTGNSLAAIIDLLVCLEQRTFSKQAANMKTLICFGYIFWLLLCRFVTGAFAYPFM